jgi:hypothetical protein
MRRLLFALLTLGAVTLVMHREQPARRPVAVSQAAELEPVARPANARRRAPSAERVVREGGAMPEVTIESELPKSPDEVRERIREESVGTYIDEILLSRDSALVRWPDRRDEPLRIWVARGAEYPDWYDFYADRVREAFTTWETQGIPVRFTFVVDSADADIHVNWVDHFDATISGKTLWSRDKRYWIIGGNITLALHHSSGEPLDGNAIYAIALHECGHLLGLDHTMDQTNIMTPRVRVRELSAADRATIKLLYSLPPGSIK